jgi:hypothetical protein
MNVIELASNKLLDPVTSGSTSDAQIMERRAIERWENEGGEIPNTNIRFTVYVAKTKTPYSESKSLGPIAFGRSLLI